MLEGGEYQDRFSGKSADDELDKEDQGSDSEEVVADLKQAHEDVKRKLPIEFNQTIEDIISTVEIHFDANDEAWSELVDELTAFLADADTAEEDVIEESAHDLSTLEKKALDLAKKKTH
jgi:hypothetical protein